MFPLRKKREKKNCYLKRRPNRPIMTNTFHLYPRTILTESSLAKVYVAICPLLSSTLSTKKFQKPPFGKSLSSHALNQTKSCEVSA